MSSAESSSPPTAQSIVLRCESCGGTLPTPDIASVLCPGCGEVNRIDGVLLESLRAHQQRVGHYRAQVDQATEQAIGARLMHVLDWRWAAGFTVSWLVAGVVMMPNTIPATLLALAIFVGPFVGLFVHLRRTERSMRAEIVGARPQQALVYVACGTCGGQSECRPDEPVHPCGYCGGTLAADADSRAAMIAEARDVAEQERWMAIHQRWKSSAKTRRDPATDLVPYFVVGGIGSLLVIGSLVTTIRLLINPGLEIDTAGFVVMNVLSLAVVLGVGLPLWRRRRRARRWAAALESLAQPTGGHVERKLSALADWLTVHWRGEFPEREICGGRQYALVTSTRAPIWALSIAPIALKEGLVTRHVRLIVPGNARGTALTRIAGSMRALGMQVRLEDAGLVAHWVEAQTDPLYDEPDRLQQVADALASASPARSVSPAEI